MAPARKRENRENQFYDVGVQGRKTGITLEDRGVRDEHGLEPISGIFSSPQKSPPKRGASSRKPDGTMESESMDIQESSIPDLATSAHILRNSRTHLPPPKARSPIKTALGSSPRRQSSMGPRARSVNPPSSPLRAASHPAVNRVLDFEQGESSLQETPALSGSGQPRGKRRSVYDIETSPTRGDSTTLEESIQEEIIANEDSAMVVEVAEESYVADIGNDTLAGADTEVTEESEVILEPPKQPAKRGRKRKSEAIEPVVEEEAPKVRRRGAELAQAPEKQKKGKKTTAPAPVTAPRRSKRVSDATEGEPSIVAESSAAAIQETDTPPIAPKRRGRPPMKKPQPEKAVPTKEMKSKQREREQEKENEEPAFKKPKSVGKPKTKADPPAARQEAEISLDSGKLVDVYGKPIPQAEIDQMSTTSAGTRFGRGRQLSIFRELEPEAVAHVGRTGRHRVQPVQFWRNESITYGNDMSMRAVVKNEYQEPVPHKQGAARWKGKKRARSTTEEEEEADLEPWEEDDGIFVGIYRDYDAVAEVTSKELVETNIAWAQKGVNPVDVPDASFKFTKLGSVGEDNFLSWGFIELQADQMKRTKNSRRMHMLFHVQSGAVEVKIHENVFTLHRGGVCQVPRGNTYSIKNVGTGTSRIFFAQGCETSVAAE
ncbi:hypothetical protein CC80DRAFT_236198 [Byssothecium circinans]|uniref:Mif2/CENP-C cupin domain-containing protein n=1 Tax=Byssothecium circinans TaxID=147558 RepID=A0A6A5U9H9_9PLEO|nr:hypothetical protein CC80DRAFT_236198 [Byssothecium circinans]